MTARAAQPVAIDHHRKSAGVPEVRLRLLDGFALQVGGGTVELQPAGQRLLAFLALTGAPVERRFASGRLWPDATEERAKANLRSAIWRVRRIHCSLVTPSKSHLMLMSSMWVDIRDGLRELTCGTGAQELIDDIGVSAVLHEDLLPDWYDDWLVTERERIRQLRLHMFERCACDLIDQGRMAEAIQIGLRGIAMDPLRESAHRVVVIAHLAEGNVGGALSQYQRFAEILDRELGLAPSERIDTLVAPWLPAGRTSGRPRSPVGVARDLEAAVVLSG